MAKLFGIADGLRLLGRPRKLSRDIPMLIMIGSDDPLGGPRSVELLAKAYRERGGLTDVTRHGLPGGPARDVQRDQPGRGARRRRRLARRAELVATASRVATRLGCAACTANSRCPAASSSSSTSMSCDGRIADFRLAGDFFLEPDEALGAIDAAVNGLPVETDAAAHRRRRAGGAARGRAAARVHARGGRRPRSAGRCRQATELARLRLAARAPAARCRPLMHLALDEVLAEEVGDGTPQARPCASGSGTSRPS